MKSLNNTTNTSAVRNSGYGLMSMSALPKVLTPAPQFDPFR